MMLRLATTTITAALFLAWLSSDHGRGRIVQAAQSTAPTPLGDEQKKPAAPDPGQVRTIEFDTDEGTWMNLDVSPDGRTIVFDLLGDIYTLPIDGGEATVIAGGRSWDDQPRFSPDGNSIAFLSDRDGGSNLWVMNTDGTGARQVSKERTDHFRSPAWTPDGAYIVVAYVRSSGKREGGLRMYHRDGGTGVKLTDKFMASAGPAPAPDGRYVYFAGRNPGAGDNPWHLQRLDRESGEVTPVTSGRTGGFRPRISPDGRWLVYSRRADAVTTLRIRDLSSGAERVLVPAMTFDDSEGFGTQDVLPHFGFMPDSSAIVVPVGGRIQRVSLSDSSNRPIAFRAHVSQQLAEAVRAEARIDDGDVNPRILRWPTIARDEKRVAFSALGKIWISSLPDGTSRRLTTGTAREYCPSFSPDGTQIAYTTWSDDTAGQVVVVSADGGQPRVVTTVPGHYANPSWSADGSKLVFIRTSGAELRGEQPHATTGFELMWVPSTGGAPRVITTVEAPDFALRFHTAPRFNHDGSRVFFTQHKIGTPGHADLLSVRLDGSDKKAHLRFRYADEIVPSPDGTRVALIFRDDLWVVALPPYTGTMIEVNLETPSVPAKRFTTEGGVYPSWQDAETVSWIFGNRLYRQSVADPRPTVLADLKLSVPRARPDGRIAFTNARIITMEGDQVIERGTVVVDGSRLSAVGRSRDVAIPDDATIVDATGLTIMPGLVDVHAHMHYGSYETFPQQRWEYIACLAYGVTTTMDPSAHSLDVFGQSEMVETGELLGPRIFSTGDVILGDVNHPTYVNIRSIDDARHVAKRHKQYGAIMLKEYMLLRRDQRQYLAQAAREEGIGITAEGGSDLAMDLTFVADGYTAFEHSLPIAPLYNDVVQFLARARTHYTPTLIVSYGGPRGETYFYNQANYHDDPKLRRFTPEDSLDRWRRVERMPDSDWHFLRVSKSAAAIVRAGGLVDMGAHGNRHGLGSQWEMWSLAMGGLTALEAIRASTLSGAEKIGLDRFVGSLHAGKAADFLVLTANPLEDIRSSAKIRYTVKNGFVYDAESMTQVWPEWRPLETFFWQADEDRARFAAPEPSRLRRVRRAVTQAQ